MAEFGENLRKAREAVGYTQSELAEKLFVTKRAVSRWECGERYPDLMTVKKIAEEFGVSTDELLSVEDKEKCQDKKAILGGCIMDNSKNLMIQSALFAVTFAAYVFMALLFGKFLWEQWQVLKDESELVQGFFMKIIGFYSFVSISTYVVSAAALLWGLISSIKKGLTLRQNRIILSLFFVIRLFSVISQVVLGTELSYVLPAFLETLFMIIVICLFFSGRKGVSPVPVYLMCGIYALDLVVTVVQNLLNYVKSGTGLEPFLISVLGSVSCLCLVAMISFQVYYTNKCRRNFKYT